MRVFFSLVFAFLITHSSNAQPNIIRVEWYIDTDPGYGNATPINITPGQDLNNISFTANTASATSGLHIIGMRGMDANGAWSLDNKWLFIKPANPTNAANITKVEWYMDTDPGYGNATPISITPGQDLTNVSFTANTASATPGLHIIGMRGMDANGAWSLDNKWLVSKSVAAVAASNIVQMEYYIDTDPGYGNAIPLAFVHRQDADTLKAFVNVTGLSSGWHKIFYRGKDANGAWSLDNPDSFMIGTPIATPAILVNSLEFTPVCKGGIFKIGYHATGTYNAGNNFITELSDKNGSFSNLTQVGTLSGLNSGLINCVISSDADDGTNYKLRVRSTNPVVVGDISEQNISVNKYYIGNDTFAIVVCANNTANITNLYNPLNSTITWSVSNPVQAPLGIHSLYAINNFGCKDTALVTVKQNVATWTGNTSIDWHVASNWNIGSVPTDSTHVIIPGGTINGCTIGNADASASSIQVRSGALAVQIINNRKLMVKANCSSLPN